jgi:hypothetical protein
LPIINPVFPETRMPRKETCPRPKTAEDSPKNTKSVFPENKNAPKRDMHTRQSRRRQSQKYEKIFSENKNAPKRDMHTRQTALLAPTRNKRCLRMRILSYHICSHKNAPKKVPQIT